MTEPYTVHTIRCTTRGRLGLSPLPGRHGDLANDLETIANWAPDLVVSMTEEAEMNAAGANDLGQRLAARNIAWTHLPIADFAVPNEYSNALWLRLSERIHAILDIGGGVLLHCKGGRGRSGMILLRILVERGENPEAALERLRRVRPGAVETAAQLSWATAGQSPATFQPK